MKQKDYEKVCKYMSTYSTNPKPTLLRVKPNLYFCAVPDVHLSKNLTARQFYADRKRCDWSARTPPSVCTWVLCVFLSTVI